MISEELKNDKFVRFMWFYVRLQAIAAPLLFWVGFAFNVNWLQIIGGVWMSLIVLDGIRLFKLHMAMTFSAADEFMNVLNDELLKEE